MPGGRRDAERSGEQLCMWQERISVGPAVLVGKPVIKGTRLAVECSVGLLAQG